MLDLKDKNVYSSAAFEPSDKELAAAAREEREAKKSRSGNNRLAPPAQIKDKKPTIMDIDLLEISDSDDDDMPSLKQIIAKQKVKGE